MPDDSDTPLCGRRIFLYPGDPDGRGIIAYDAEDYRGTYNNIEFVDSSQFIQSLEEDIRLRNRSLLQLSDGVQFDVPDYQRNFSWTIDQHEELWDIARSIVSLQTKPRDKPSDTYFGTVYIAKSSSRDVYEVIDGQQRLATVTILLHNIGQKISELIPEVSGDLEEYAKHVREEYIENILYRRKGPKEVPYITLNDHDNTFFQLLFQDKEEAARSLQKMEQYDGRKKNAIKLRNLLNELDIEKDVYGSNGMNIDDDVLESFRYYADSHQKLVQANEFYSDAIDRFLDTKKFTTSDEKIKATINLTHFVLRSLRVSECLFKTDDPELRIEVFQSLNDRGMELSKMDKVRARIVGRFQGESDSDTQIGRWENVVREFGGNSEAVEDFLSHYLAATEKEFETVSDAKDELLEAFRLKEVERTQIKSRLASAGEARDFLEELEQYAQRYQEIIDSDLVDDHKKLKPKYREECEAILTRLNGLNTSQWRPFVMYVYQKVTETPGKGEFLRDILKTVENITFRVALSPHVATVVDDTYPKTTQKFIEREQTGNQFNEEAISEILINNIDSSARNAFGENFADTVISERNWQNNQTKQLYLKISDERYREENQSGITNTWLSQSTNEVHIEHVFPEQFLLKDKSNPYAWLENYFKSDDTNRIESRIEHLKSRSAHRLSENDDEYSEIEPIIERIEEDFVRDLGNMMLLDQEINESVQNSLFAVKVKEYYNEHRKDLDNVANRYFSTDGKMSENYIDDILDRDLPTDVTDSTDREIKLLNEWWSYERAIERKAELIEEILKSLTFESREDEFSPVMGNIEEMVRNDYDTRFTLLSG